MELSHFLEKAWQKYCSITPDAARVHELIRARGDSIFNDHVAFRTFQIPGISRLEVGRIFENWGYVRRDDMDFVEKKLKATYWLHPDPSQPKIFISELLLDQISPDLRDWIGSITSSFVAKKRELQAEDLLTPLWDPPRFTDYQQHYAESEYAAWTAAFGIQVNHFTVFVNALKSFQTLSQLNDFLQSHGFVLNSAGGLIKGSAEEKLEQSSTLAKRIPWTFTDGESREIMSCYYEFAKRYPIGPGQDLFQGFIPKSADKIFESTYEKKMY